MSLNISCLELSVREGCGLYILDTGFQGAWVETDAGFDGLFDQAGLLLHS